MSSQRYGFAAGDGGGSVKGQLGALTLSTLASCRYIQVRKYFRLSPSLLPHICM